MGTSYNNWIQGWFEVATVSAIKHPQVSQRLMPTLIFCQCHFIDNINMITLTCGNLIIQVQYGKFQVSWCPGSLRRQDLSSHGIDYVE